LGEEVVWAGGFVPGFRIGGLSCGGRLFDRSGRVGRRLAFGLRAGFGRHVEGAGIEWGPAIG
jgi:hypothetical protein